MADQSFARLFHTGAANFPGFAHTHASVNMELHLMGDDLSTLLHSYHDSIPTTLAFVDASCNGMVYFAHSPTLFLATHGDHNARLENKVVCFLGSDPDIITPVIFDGATFNTAPQHVTTRTTEHIASYNAHLGMGGAPPVMVLVPEQLVAVDPNNVGCIPDDGQTRGATRTLPTSTPSNAELQELKIRSSR